MSAMRRACRDDAHGRVATALILCLVLVAGGALSFVADSMDGDDDVTDVLAGLPLDARCPLPPPLEATSLHLAPPCSGSAHPPAVSTGSLRAPPTA